MRRRAFTVAEVLVALAIGFAVLAAILGIFQAIRRMSHMGDLAGTLQEAAMAMAYIEKDLSQAVQKPDPKFDSAVIVGKDYFQMLKAECKPDGAIAGQLVIYQTLVSPGGNLRLRRRQGAEGRAIPGLFRQVSFQQLKGPGGPYVRVTLTLATHDVTATTGKASEEAVVTGLVRVMGPEMVGSKAYSFGFMEGLNEIKFLEGL
jgi:hypothetical protein